VNNASGPNFFDHLVWSVLALLAAIWNFQIDILDKAGVLSAFVRRPIMFVGLGLALSMAFPPALVIYVLAWLGASHFKPSKDTNYRAPIK
jgi:hypothetical protein